MTGNLDASRINRIVAEILRRQSESFLVAVSRLASVTFFRPPMKLKCQPEDFRVEELPLVSPGGPGRYAFYRLTKRSVGDARSGRPDLPALEPRRPARLVRRSQRPARPDDAVPHDLRRPVGARSTTRPTRSSIWDGSIIPIGPADFRGNRFDLVIRDLSGARKPARTRSGRVARVGRAAELF